MVMYQRQLHFGPSFVSRAWKRMGAVHGTVQRTWQPMTEGERVSRNRSPWYSLGYLPAVAVIVVVIVLLIPWVV